uniref:Retrovirus-related Pol polyprotein from transposon TNT 1-94 n=1 Tax=Cajanus cajan TaxID=3821 RepID=A0A151SNX6_CAJCA|nr:hypothetical protein KK1_002777 [Cajanus cajan]
MTILHKQYDFIPMSKHVACDICHSSRQKRFSFRYNISNAKFMFDLVHMDIWGPFSTKFVYGYCYFLTMVDDYSRYTWVVMMKTKYDVISFATQQLSQFMSTLTEAHHRRVMRILRYLKQSLGHGLFFPRNSNIQVLGFSNANWGSCIDTLRSIFRYCFFLGHSLVAWKSKKQPIVSCSSSEAEYRALVVIVRKLQWLTFLVNDLHQTPSRTFVLYWTIKVHCI